MISCLNRTDKHLLTVDFHSLYLLIYYAVFFCILRTGAFLYIFYLFFSLKFYHFVLVVVFWNTWNFLFGSGFWEFYFNFFFTAKIGAYVYTTFGIRKSGDGGGCFRVHLNENSNFLQCHFFKLPETSFIFVYKMSWVHFGLLEEMTL